MAGCESVSAQVMCLPLKILGCLILTAAGFGAGCLFSARLYRRRDFLRRLQGFLSSLSTDLRYRGEDIFTLVTECAKRAGLTALSVQPSEDSFENAWNKAINGVCAAFPLQREDESLLREIGSQLGKTDLEGQLRHLSLIETRLAERLRDAEESLLQKAKLCKTMGFFVGAATAIVLM